VEKTTPPTNKPLSESPDEITIPDYPALLKHMVLAIFVSNRLPRQRPAFSKNKIPVRSSPNKDAFDPTKFNAAMDVALAQLKKYQMITEKSSRTLVTLTAKGRDRDNAHKREPGSRTKTRRFDKLYIQLIIEGKKRVRRPPETEGTDPNQPKPKNVGPQPVTNPDKPKTNPLRPKQPVKASLRPANRPDRPKVNPLRVSKPTTPKARRVSRAASVKRARRG